MFEEGGMFRRRADARGASAFLKKRAFEVRQLVNELVGLWRGLKTRSRRRTRTSINAVLVVLFYSPPAIAPWPITARRTR